MIGDIETPARFQFLLDAINELEDEVLRLQERIHHLEEAPEIDYGAPDNTHEECEAHTCSYWTHYLAYGPVVLEHEGYHAAERMYAQHTETCQQAERGHDCLVCRNLESRVRA